MLTVKLALNDQEIWCSAKQAKTLETLLSCAKGGFARVHGYVSDSGRVTPETADMTFLSRFSLARMYERRIAALEAITFEQARQNFPMDHAKFKGQTEENLRVEFNKRKAFLIGSLMKTLDGVRDDAHRQGHDRCYATIGEGVKVHFITEKNKDDGKMYPVLKDGCPQVKSIMVNAIEVSRTVLVEGKYKVTDSRLDVMIGNIIEKDLPKGTKFKCLSLGDEKFDKIVIDSNAILSEEFAGIA